MALFCLHLHGRHAWALSLGISALAIVNSSAASGSTTGANFRSGLVNLRSMYRIPLEFWFVILSTVYVQYPEFASLLSSQ
jgi:hypothetical protein